MKATYIVRWHFLSRLCASAPPDPEVIRRWLEARAMTHSTGGRA